MFERKSLFCALVIATPVFSEPAPDLEGKTLSEIGSEFGDASFSLVVQQVESTEAKGRVFLQVPSPSADMGVNAMVYVRVSEGLMIPTGITGRDAEAVAAELTDRGFSVEHTETQVLGAPKGTIAASIPPEGTFIDATQQVVYLQVSNDSGVAVPNLAGLRLSQAIDTLSALGLSGKLVTELGLPHVSFCDGHTINTVIYTAEVLSSDPPQGTYLAQGSEVKMEGKKIVSGTMPDGGPCFCDERLPRAKSDDCLHEFLIP